MVSMAAQQDHNAAQVFLTWKDLTVKIPGSNGHHRYLLRNVSGFASPGSLLAIMGPSGCGKTTLLNTLAGRLGEASMENGVILANGRKQRLSYGNSAYVTQDDSLIATLTVYETLLYSAHLQLPSSMSNFEKQQRVQKSIREMGLQESVNTRVGGWYIRGLSGGEKRRLSIAIETLKQPWLLFLDEPTSGLDSAAAFHVIKRLCAISKSGRTLLVSIHQPSSEVFQLFHYLCLLSSGQTVYFGERNRAQQFFEDAGFPCPPLRNPSDHFLWIVNSEFDENQDDTDVENVNGVNMQTIPRSQLIIKAYEDLGIKRSVDLVIQQASRKDDGVIERKDDSCVSIINQIFYLTKRSFTNMMRDIAYYWFRLAVYIILCTCVGTIYYKVGFSYDAIQARAGLFIFVTAFLTFMGVASFPSFIEDMKIFTRERLNGQYGVAVFVIANTLSAFPFVVLMAFFPGIIMYTMIGLHSGFGHFIYFFVTLLATLCVEEALLMAIASIAPDFLTGMIAGCGIMGMYLLNGGFFRLLKDLPKPVWRYPLSYISFHTWACKAFYNNDFKGLVFNNNEEGVPPLTGEYILKERFGLYISYSKWWLVFILVCMAIGYRIVFFVSIKMKEVLPTFLQIFKPETRFVVPRMDHEIVDHL